MQWVFFNETGPESLEPIDRLDSIKELDFRGLGLLLKGLAVERSGSVQVRSDSGLRDRRSKPKKKGISGDFEGKCTAQMLKRGVINSGGSVSTGGSSLQAQDQFF